MRTVLFIFVITSMTIQNVIAQEDTIKYPRPKLWQEPDTNMQVNKLIRNWELANINQDTLIYYSGDNVIKRPWNQACYLMILPYNQLKEGFTAGCGNDERIRSSNGEWQFDSNKMELETTVPIDKYGKRFQIISLTTTKLTLKKMQ